MLVSRSGAKKGAGLHNLDLRSGEMRGRSKRSLSVGTAILHWLRASGNNLQ